MLCNTLKMHSGGEGYVSDAEVIVSERHTVFSAQYTAFEVPVV